MTFGETAILPDGRAVVTPWLQPGCWVGDTFWDGPVLLQPDACMTADGHVWVVAKGHDDLNLYVRRDTWPDWLAVGRPVGSRAIIRDNGGGTICVSFANLPTQVFSYGVDGSGAIETLWFDPIPDGSGGNGMRDYGGENGEARPMSPLDTPTKDYDPFNGIPARGAITYGGTTIGRYLGDPGQLLIARNGVVGTLLPGGGDFIRMSQDGRYFAWTRYSPPANGIGNIPAVIPPLVLTPPVPMPDVSLVVPARANFRLGSFAFNNDPYAEPNPHHHLGSVILPIRLTTPWDGGDVIWAGQDQGTRIAVYAGEDGSQTCEQAIQRQRPQAVAWGVGLAVYMDSAGPVRPSILALMQPGDVFMPQWRDPAHLSAPSMGYPLCPAVEIQRLSDADAATLIIAASQTATDSFGAILFATDRSDCSTAVMPYLDRWASGIITPATWPTPQETPVPQLPAKGFAYLHNSLLATVDPSNPTVLEIAHQPNVAGAWQEIEVAKSATDPAAVTVRFTASNRFLRIDRVLTRDQKYDQALETYDATQPDADTAWQQGVLSGPFVHYLSEPVDGHQGVAYSVRLVDGAGAPLFR